MALLELCFADASTPVCVLARVLGSNPDVVAGEAIKRGRLVVAPTGIARGSNAFMEEVPGIMELPQWESRATGGIGDGRIERRTHGVVDHNQVAVVIGHERAEGGILVAREDKVATLEDRSPNQDAIADIGLDLPPEDTGNIDAGVIGHTGVYREAD